MEIKIEVNWRLSETYSVFEGLYRRETTSGGWHVYNGGEGVCEMERGERASE